MSSYNADNAFKVQDNNLYVMYDFEECNWIISCIHTKHKAYFCILSLALVNTTLSRKDKRTTTGTGE